MAAKSKRVKPKTKRPPKKKRAPKVDVSKYLERTGKAGGHDGPSHRFKKGNPGKPKGTKDKGPLTRRQKASVKALIEELVLDHETDIRKAIRDGLKAGPRHADRYLRLVTEYTDGKPVDTLNVNPWRLDEIETATRSLDKKIEATLAAILRKRQAAEGTPAAGGDQPVSDQHPDRASAGSDADGEGR